MSQDGDPVCQALRLIQVVGAQHDAATGMLEADDELADRARRKWVQSGRRLVQENDLRLVQQRSRERDLLLHAARKAGDACGAQFVKIEQTQQLVDASSASIVVEPIDAPEKVQITPGRHLIVQARCVGHQPHARANGGRVGAHVATRHGGFAGGRRE